MLLLSLCFNCITYEMQHTISVFDQWLFAVSIILCDWYFFLWKNKENTKKCPIKIETDLILSFHMVWMSWIFDQRRYDATVLLLYLVFIEFLKLFVCDLYAHLMRNLEHTKLNDQYIECDEHAKELNSKDSFTRFVEFIPYEIWS